MTSTRISARDKPESLRTFGSLEELTKKVKSSIKTRRENTLDDWMIDAFRLEEQGVSRAEIASKLHREKPAITKLLGTSTEGLGRLAVVALLSREAYLKLKAAKYYKWLGNKVYGPPSKRLREYTAARRAAGILTGKPPIGYQFDKSLLVEDPKTSSHIKRIYERLAEGEPYDRATRAEGLRPHLLTIRSRVYLGYLRQNGREIQGRHPPLIGEDLWKRAMAALDKRPHGANKAPFGLRILGGHYRPGEAEDVKKIREAFEMRARGSYYHEISKHIGLSLSSGSVNDRLKDRRYVDAGIIDLKTYQLVQKIPRRRPFALAMKMQGQKREVQILELLRKRPLHSTMIIAKMGLTQAAVNRYLHRLMQNRSISKGPKAKDPYSITTEGLRIFSH